MTSPRMSRRIAEALRVELESKLTYDEPPPFHYAVRQSLGAVLLEAGAPARAEQHPPHSANGVIAHRPIFTKRVDHSNVQFSCATTSMVHVSDGLQARPRPGGKYRKELTDHPDRIRYPLSVILNPQSVIRNP